MKDEGAKAVRKPRLFIASSAEALPVANAVNMNLDHELEVTIWTAGTFKLSSLVIPDLLDKSSQVDFALFIFTPDDLITIRGETAAAVRDNVYFELGLFVGAIGRERCFILVPRGEPLHLPSDLLGLTTADYDPNRTDGDLASATNRACTQIRNEIGRHGLILRELLSAATRMVANPVEYPLGMKDYKFIVCCLQSRTTRPEGISFLDIANAIKEATEQQLQLVAMKLQRMQLVEVSIETEPFEGRYDFLAYRATDAGVDLLLANEDKISTAQVVTNSTAGEFEDDIPF